MSMLKGATLAQAGLDGVALKPTEVDVSRAAALDVEVITIDYEGNEHVPDADVLTDLAADKSVRVTAPVRADGFDPQGDDSLLSSLPAPVDPVLVAGNPAYLTDEECRRPVAPRLDAAADGDHWVGTEGVERTALAVGGTQFELLSRTSMRDLQSLRAAGFDGELALYAPTVVTDDEDAILDGLGAYLSRRRPVRQALPEGARTDSAAEGRARNVLLQAASDYALVGTQSDVADRVEQFREAGADVVVGYPARGLDPVLE
ncbi:luciferase [Haloarculaceae archaeon H-GB2-1]|nr:luciferase [Haloarculaceae archaeon H-GB1-1]MEA5387700.1 luciferase [Haloarculaceae archaeon H-GB11]MEA5409190.1 luciferase [Haloarculaceae archaeon H-GB2-1]